MGELFEVDVDLPTVDVNPLVCQTTGNVTVSAACGDVGSGVASCEVSIDGGASWFPSPHLYVGLADGNYTAIGRAADNCGNTASDPVGEPFEVDTVAVVTITYPVAGVTIATGDLTVTGTADTDIATVMVITSQGLTGEPYISPVVGGNWSVTLLAVAVPSITITAQGMDNCGNIGSDSVTVPVVPPGCVIVSVGPTTGCPADLVTITGSGFGPNTNIVSFDATQVTVISWGSTSIVVIAPGGNYSNVTVTPLAANPCSLPGTYFYDDEIPTVDVDPLLACYTTGNVTVSAACGDVGSGVALCEVSIDGGANWFASPHVYNGLTTGNYTAIGRVEDNCGNTASDLVGEPFEVDVDLPTVDVDPLACQTTGAVTVSAVCGDVGSGVASCEVSIDGGANWFASPHTYTGLITGGYTAIGRVTDNCGNTASDLAGEPFEVDVDLPTVDVNPLACQTTGNVTVSATCLDVGSGPATCEVSINGGANWFASPHLYVGLPDGDYTAIGRVEDNCGNTASDLVGETFEVDTAAVVTITYPVDGVTVVAGDLTVTGTADTDITTVTVTSDQGHSESSAVDPVGNWSVVLTGVTVPSIVITAAGTDDCGNIGSDTVTVPVVPPVCLIASVGPTTGCPGVQVTITGTNFGPVAGTVSFDATTATIVSWGNASITVEAPGGMYGNVIVAPATGGWCSLPGTYFYDDVPPEALITSPADGNTECSSTVVVVGTATDFGGSGIFLSGVTVSLPGASDTPQFVLVDAAGNWTAAFHDVPPGGPHTITASVEDGCGLSDVDSINIYVDTTPPLVLITSPVDGNTECSSTVVVVGTATDFGESGIFLGGVTVSLPGASDTPQFVPVDAGGNWTAVFHDVAPDGPHTITASVQDECGWMDTEVINILVDTTPPTVDVDPLLACYTTGTVTVSATCNDVGSGVAACEVSIDGGASWFASPHVYNGLTTGNYTAIGRATDNCGYTDMDLVGEAFDVDVDAPTVNVSPLTCQTTGLVTVSATCDDVGSGVAACEVSIDGGASWFASPHVFAGLVTNNYTAIGRATDNCGNTASDLVGELFEVDVDAPTVDVDPIPPCSTTGNVTVSAFCDDVGSGLVSCEVSVDGGLTWFASPHVYNGLITGNYRAIGRAADNCGNTGSDLVGEEFEVDVDLPTVDVDPIPACSTTGNVMVSATCNDVGSGLASCEVSIDGGANWFASPHFYVGLPTGSYTAIGQATDNCGNTAQDLVGETFEVDVDLPTVVVDPILPACSTTGNVTVSATCNDVGSGVAACEVSIDDGANWFPSPHLYVGLPDGDYTAIGQATDNCGNLTQDLVGVTFEVDTVAMVTISYPVDGVTVVAGDLTVVGTADTDITTVTVTSDQGHSESSAVDPAGNWSVILAGVTVPSIVITATGTDNCGNIGSDTVTVPVVPPVCLIVSVGPTTGCPGVQVTITGTNFGPVAGTVSFDATTATIVSWSNTSITVEAPGGMYGNVIVFPATGGFCSLPGIYFYDNQAPIVDVDPIPICSTTGTVTVSVTCDDNIGSGIASCEVSINGGSSWFASPHAYSGLTTGSYTAIGRATDNCGNTASDLVGEVFEVDVDLPTVDVAPMVCQPAGLVTVSATCDDVGSGVAACEVSIDDGANWFASPHIYAGLAEGPYTAIGQVRDNCGNLTQDLVGEAFTVDITLPEVLITSPVDGSTYCTSTVVVVGTATDFGGSGIFLDRVTVDLPGASDSPQSVLVDAAGNWSTSFHNVSPDGLHTITASVEDECGWTDAHLVNILVDTTPPVVIINIVDIASVVKVEGTATDSGGFGIFRDGVTVSLLGASDTPQFVSLDAGGNWSASFHDTPPGGPYTITAWVEDECGRTGIDQFVIEIPLAYVTIVSPAEGECINTMPVVVTGTFSGFPDAALVEVLVNGVSATETVLSATTGSFTATLTSVELPEGLNRAITAVASDGTYIANDTTLVNVDLTPPVVLITSPAAGSTYCSSTVVVVGTVSDSGIGPATTIAVTMPGSSQGTVIVPVGVGGDWSAIFTVPATGPYTATATIQDLCGNTGSESIGFYVDLELPTATVTAPTINECITVPTVTVTAQCDDNIGIASCEVTVDGGTWMPSGTVFNLADGPHTAQARATDTCGNTGISSPVPFRVDTVAPVSIATPTGGLYTSAVIVVLTATDTQDPSPDIFYDVNETGSFDPYLGPILISTTTTLDFYAVDNCGNIEAPINREVYTFTGCIVGITTPAPGECINTMPVTVTGSFEAFSDANLVNVIINGVVDAVEIVLTPTSGSYSATMLLPEGPQTITAVASDGACTAIASITVYVDLTPPLVSITQPTDGSTVCTSQVVVLGSCSDPGGIGITSCVVEVDGQTADLSLGSATFSLADGYYTATLTATDSCVLSSSTSVSFWVDTAPPVISIIQPTLPPLVYDNRGTDIWGTIWDPSVCGPGAITYRSPTSDQMFGLNDNEIGAGHVVRAQAGDIVVVPININLPDSGPNSYIDAYQILVDFDETMLSWTGTNGACPECGADANVPSPWTGPVGSVPDANWETDPVWNRDFGDGILILSDDYLVLPPEVTGSMNIANICIQIDAGAPDGVYDVFLYANQEEGGFVQSMAGQFPIGALAGSIEVYTPTPGMITIYDGDDVDLSTPEVEIDITVTTDAVDGASICITLFPPPCVSANGGSATLRVDSFANGPNTLIAYVADQYCPGNIGYSDPLYVEYFAALPVSIASPTGGLLTETDDVAGAAGVQINVAVSAPSATNGSTVNITVNGSTTDGDSGVISGGGFTGTVTLSEGSNLIEMVVVDPELGTGTDSVTVELDTIAPSIVSVEIDNGDIYTNDPMVNVTISATDPGAGGVQWMQVACDGAVDAEPLEPYAGSYVCTLIPAIDGTRTVEVVVWDGAGHSSAPDSDTIDLDMTDPTVNITSPTCGSTFVTTTVVVDANCADVTCGVNTCQVSLDGGAWFDAPQIYVGLPDGPHTAYARATDNAGNVNNAPPCNFVIFSGLLQLTITSPAEGAIFATNNVSITGTYDQAGLVPVILANMDPMTTDLGVPDGNWWGVVSALSEGWVTITATGDDTFNITTDSVNICVDTVVPNVTVNPLACQNTTTVVVTGTANDPAPNCGAITQVMVGGVPADISGLPAWTATVVLAEGANTVTAVATDAAGNTGSGSTVIDVDTIPPAVAITIPTGGACIGTSEVCVIVSVFNGGIPSCTMDGYGPIDPSGECFTGVADGTYTITCVSMDACGNAGLDVLSPVIVDITPPTVNITQPLAGQTLATDAVVVQFNANDVTSGVDTASGVVTLAPYGSQAATYSAPTFTAVFSGVTNGAYTATACVNDNCGNTGCATVAFAVNVTATGVGFTMTIDYPPDAGLVVTVNGVTPGIVIASIPADITWINGISPYDTSGLTVEANGEITTPGPDFVVTSPTTASGRINVSCDDTAGSFGTTTNITVTASGVIDGALTLATPDTNTGITVQLGEIGLEDAVIAEFMTSIVVPVNVYYDSQFCGINDSFGGYVINITYDPAVVKVGPNALDDCSGDIPISGSSGPFATPGAEFDANPIITFCDNIAGSFQFWASQGTNATSPCGFFNVSNIIFTRTGLAGSGTDLTINTVTPPFDFCSYNTECYSLGTAPPGYPFPAFPSYVKDGRIDVIPNPPPVVSNMVPSVVSGGMIFGAVINGFYFQPGILPPDVTINGIASVAVTVASDKQLTNVAFMGLPVDGGFYDLQVCNPDAQCGVCVGCVQCNP
ncbi:MAG: hypothetical protein JSU92_09500 [Deltaproteobacteria bacterium]|nr:MAG: hypothetical protein JSU92_09500 [Deltaproteobacteria bacterium]